MKKIIAFGASNSLTSINKQLAVYASSLIENKEVEILDLNNFKIPTYSIDIETKIGIPENAQHFFDKIKSCDGIIISLAEHNGNYTAAFKSLFDWMSRIDKNIFQDKNMLLMSTSPGGRAGKSVFDIAEASFPRFAAKISAKFSLPSFNENFKEGKIINEALNQALVKEVNAFLLNN
ncbi:NADPH-dependent FMN reductase [Olleya sp. R77988]|uniref:NADPH-dependent FMN reductase n=1 Tax=Olleya sp. R77988 TaxID=3093875 RepID=UPI0037CA051E